MNAVLARRKLVVRRGQLVIAASVLVVVGLIGFGTTARADSPSSQGWWTSANPGSVGGLGAPASPPAPPDVPSNGLLIEGGATTSSGAGNSGASAYAALIYDVPDGATLGKLNLTVAPNSATTPSTTLELCPLTTQSFQAEEGGPMSDAPSYNCSNNITAAQASSAYVFDVSSLVSSGALAVAILPTSPADRVVLSQPGTKSLDVQPAPDTTVASPPGSGSPSGFGSSLPTDTGTAVGAAPTAPFVSALPLTPSSSAAPEPLLAQPRSTQGAPVANPSTQNSDRALVASASTSTEPRAWVGVIFLVALLLAAALWMASGRSATGRDGGRPIVQR